MRWERLSNTIESVPGNVPCHPLISGKKSMHPTIQKLIADGPVVTDGAWGTQLREQDLAPGQCPDALNVSHSQVIECIARRYVEAGSSVILTNTFRANRLALASYGLADRVASINREGVAISRRAAAGTVPVFASIGPSGKLLVTGEVTERDLHQAFAEQALMLADAGADGFVVETMCDLDEAQIALEAAQPTGLPVVVCMVFDSGKDRDRTVMGRTPEQVSAALAAAGADVLGANCGAGVLGYVSICRRLRNATDRPIWIKPNAGLPEVVDGRIVYRMSPREFAEEAVALQDAGADFIGGCCGTDPDFVRFLSPRLKRKSPPDQDCPRHASEAREKSAW